MSTLTLQLRVTVTYDCQGTPEAELRRRLTYIAQHAAGEGLLTGDSAAEVETWDAEVVRIEVDV